MNMYIRILRPYFFIIIPSLISVISIANTPPQPNIILYGEVILDGQPANLPLDITVSVNGIDQAVNITQSFGITSYRLELTAGKK
jgi:hypothetical protein